MRSVRYSKTYSSDNIAKGFLLCGAARSDVNLYREHLNRQRDSFYFLFFCKRPKEQRKHASELGILRGSTALQGELQPMKIRSQQQPVGARSCPDPVARWESSCESVRLLWRDPHSGRCDGTHGYFEWELTPRARWSSRFVVNFYVAASELIVLERKVKSQGIWCWKFALRLLWGESKVWPPSASVRWDA